MLVAVVALAAALRFATLDTQSFWTDEAFTVAIARTPLHDLLSEIRSTESTPPVYYVLAWLWAKLFGTGEAGLRSLSALLGTATVPLVFHAGRQLVSRRVGLFAAALTAVSPLLVWYSQEARAYALLVFLGMLGLVLFLRALERPDSKALIGWGVVSALALGTHYFAAFTVAAEGLWLLWRLDAQRRRVVEAAVIPAVAGAALVPLLLYQREHVPRPWTGIYSVADQAAATYQEFLVGHTWTWLIHRPGVAVLSLLLGGGLLAVLRRGAPAERAAARLAGALAVISVGVPAALSLAGSNYLAPRNVLMALPLGLLVAAAGIGAARSGRVGAGALAAACAVSVAIVVAVAATPRLQRDDWRGLAAATRAHSGARLVVTGERFNNSRVARLYFGGVARPLPIPVSEVLVVSRSGSPLLAGDLPAGFTAGPAGTRGALVYARYTATTPTAVPASSIGDASVILQRP